MKSTITHYALKPVVSAMHTIYFVKIKDLSLANISLDTLPKYISKIAYNRETLDFLTASR